MPPRARKKAAPKPVQEENTVTEVTETDTVDTPDVETPEKKRPGRKRSELAHAARNYEQSDDAVQRLEVQYQKLATKLSEVGAKLSEARATRDAAWEVIETARNARVAPDVADPSGVDDDADGDE